MGPRRLATRTDPDHSFPGVELVDVLVVNAQPVWANRIRTRLESTGARVSVAANAAEASRIMEEADEWPDAIVVEHRILEKQSASLMAGLKVDEWQPIIIPTDFQHLSQDSTQVPLRGEEVLRRLEALVVRLKGVFEPTAHQFVRVGRLTVDPSRKEVVFAARRVPLPPIQFRLLLYLAINAGRVVDQRELVREIWGYAGTEGEARELIKKHVRLIRRKLGWTEESTNYLKSVRGFGYMLSPPPRARGRKTGTDSDTPK